MTLSLGIPLGLIVAATGAVLLRATNYRRIARVILGVGLAVTLVALVMVVLAVQSQM